MVAFPIMDGNSLADKKKVIWITLIEIQQFGLVFTFQEDNPTTDNTLGFT